MARTTRQTVAFNEAAWLSWLVKARFIVITLLLSVELAVTSFTRTNVPRLLYVSVIVVWYATAAFFAVLQHVWSDLQTQARVQVLTDLFFATLMIYVTGGVDTSFNFLYPLVIIVAAILLPRYWAYLSAALSFILFGGVLELSYFDLIPSFSVTRPDLNGLQAIILINLGAYLAIAYLASILSAKLRQVDVQLQEQKGALRNLQAVHEDIVNSISGGLMTTDLEGRITFINPAAERLVERTLDELVGLPAEELLTNRVPEVGPSGMRYETHTTTPTGARKTIGLTVSPLKVPSHGTVGYVYSFNDLTEVRRLEREIRIRDRMAAVGRLAAGIAHEIRNPLSSIAGSAKMLNESTALDDDERKLMDVIKRESERLNAIVTDFLTYSREKEYQFEQVDVVSLIEDTLTLLQNRAELANPDGGASKIEIVREFREPALSALVDANRMKQVFWNICDNAVRAMISGGTLTVSVRTAGENAEIRFSDTGVGIPPQQLDKIFEPFQSGFLGGTGLGLALVYQIVQAHGGKITVQSTPGTGTAFVIGLKRVELSTNSDQKQSHVAVAGFVGGRSGRL